MLCQVGLTAGAQAVEQTGQTLILRVTVTAQALSASRAKLLAIVKHLVPGFQATVALPITEVDLISPNDGSIVATFLSAEWQ